MQNLKNDLSNNVVKTIGLVVDATRFTETELLIKELIANGIKPNDITTILYKDTVRKTAENTFPIFNSGHITWNGKFSSTELNNFVDEKFDLLISYYDIEIPILLQITYNSEAEFKVGFSSIDKRLNHFMIKTEVNSYRIFVGELFKYLKLLKKI
nr:hypothetical protein [Flavobacterium caseinilyticum]